LDRETEKAKIISRFTVNLLTISASSAKALVPGDNSSRSGDIAIGGGAC